MRGTAIGTALIADATKIAGELKQTIGKIPIPTGKVLIPIANGFPLAMPKAETVKLSDLILQMKGPSEKLEMLKGGSTAGKEAITETAETGLTKVAQSGVKSFKGDFSKEVLAKVKERLVTLNVARTELMARIDTLISSSSTSSNTKGVLETLKNQLKNGTKQDDLIGALRDLNGKVVRRSGDGKAFQHSEEIQRTINSIKKSEKHLKEDLLHYAGGSTEFAEISKELDAMKEMKRLINEFLEIK